MERKWWTLLVVSLATFMLLLDITVVNVALPSIRRDLGASFTDLQWVVDAYALTLAALVLPAGSLADRLGRRRLFIAGLVIFSVASLLCALAPDPTLLSLARALQGVGGAVLFAVSLALVAQEFPAGRQRGTAMGLYGATIGVAVAIGPLVGGALTDGFGWASIFYLNVPVGVAALTVSSLKLRESRDPNATRVDWAGAATFSGALLLLVLALVRGNAEGWGSRLIVSLLAGSAALLVAFIAIQRRVSQPMLPLGLFRRPSFTGVQLAAFAVSGSLLAMFLYLTLYLQNYLGYSPLEAGLRYLPITLLAFLFGPIAGALLSRVPARVLLSAGLGMTGVGLLLMSGIQPGSGWTTLLGGFLVAGAGVGLLNPVIADVAVSVVPNQHSGMAAGISDTFRQVGIAVGIAVWGAILVGRGADRIAELVARTPTTSGERPRELVEAASSGNLDQALAAVAPQARQVVANAAGAGFLAGLNAVLILAALLSFAGAVLALWLVREHEIQRPQMAPERQPQSEAPTEAAGAGRAARSTGAARPAGSCPADITHVMNRPHMPGRPLVLPHEGEVGRQFPLRGRVHGPGSGASITSAAQEDSSSQGTHLDRAARRPAQQPSAAAKDKPDLLRGGPIMRKAVIVGGGVAGPVTAMALQRAGIEGVVYEAYPPTAGEVGSYLTVASNGLDALGAIGADGPVLDAGFPTLTNVLLSSSGRRLGRVSNGGRLADGTAAHTIKRARLYRALHQQASDRGIQVAFGKRLVDVQPTPDGGVLALFEDGTQAAGALLVGADGVHSVTRRLIDPAAPAGRYVGLVNFGGYTPEPATGAEPGVWHMIFGRRAFFGYVVDPAGGTVWFANVPRPPVSRAERDATGAQQWQQQLLELFAPDHGPASDLITAGQLEFAGDNTYDLPKVPIWRRGPLVVIGDAAHAPAPTSGQGASMAAEDAVVLAKCLRDQPDIGQALAVYERLRRPRVERIVAQAARTSSTKTPGPIGRLLRDLTLPVVFRLLVTERSMAWRYEHHIDWDAPITLTTNPA